MVKKISGRDRPSGGERERKQLQSKRLKLKRLHKDVVADRGELDGKSPQQLPAASASNAARQARSRLNITFPVDWQALHLKKSLDDAEQPDSEEGSERTEC